MTDGIVTDSSHVRLWSAEPMPPDQDAAHTEAAKVLALCVNSCDPEPAIAILAERASFDSQSYAGPIAGREEVAKHLREKFTAIRSSGRYPIAEVGRIDGQHRNEPGVIIFQAGAFRTFWSPAVSADGLILRIMGYTLVPHPSTARGTGERPAFNEVAHRQRERTHLERLKQQFALAKGPVIFRGFALNLAMASEHLQPLLTRLIVAFPESKCSTSIHAFSGSHEDEPFAKEAGFYDVTGYPAVAVERDGKVFRGASESFSFEAICSLLHYLLRVS